MDQTGGTWGGMSNVERSWARTGSDCAERAVWTRSVAAYKPKREVGENKIKIKKEGKTPENGGGGGVLVENGAIRGLRMSDVIRWEKVNKTTCLFVGNYLRFTA